MASLVLENSFMVKDVTCIFDCKFHPNKDNVALVSTIDGSVVILDLNANKKSETIFNLENHHKGTSVRKLDFLNPETLITCAKSVKIYDLDRGTFVRKIDNKEKTKIYSLKPIDRNVFFTGDDMGTLKMFDLRSGNEPVMNETQHEDYLSDMDIDTSNRVLLTTSGDGHLSAFNIRSKKLILQSEPFDSGFQSVRYLGHRNKVIVGAEDGALNIFNVGEWGNISDRFPLDPSKRSSGDCSIEGIEKVSDRMIITSSSDGKLRLVQIFPNKILHTRDDHKLIDANSIEESDEEVEDKETVNDLVENSSKKLKKSKSSDTKSPNTNFFADL